MRKIILTVFCGISLYGLDLSDKASDGKELYLEVECNKCHLQDSSFKPLNKNGRPIASDYKDVAKWVRNCQNFFGHGWFPEEEEAVTEYVNEIYYKYKK
jgi:hypothetical protein